MLSLYGDIFYDEIDENIILTKKNKNGDIDLSEVIVLEFIAKDIFKMIMSGLSKELIYQHLLKHYKVSPNVLEQDLNDFIENLKAEKILYD